MKIVEFYDKYCQKGNEAIADADLLLVKYNGIVYVGITEEGHVAVAVESSNINQGALSLSTKLVSVECNILLNYFLDGRKYERVFHLIKCRSKDHKEISLFLELALLLISEGEADRDDILSAFQILTSFFEDKKEPTDNELIGFYAELYAIKEYHKQLQLEHYWQSRDKLMFDFSINDKVKIEIKSTIKSQRIHHFRHDQLSSKMYEIYVISYMLRHDDQGLSLLELINICKPILEEDSRKLIRINSVLKNVDSNRLAAIRFEETLTQKNRRIFRGEDVPQFSEAKPEGVSHAEYDCNFEGAPFIVSDNFIDRITEVVKNA